MFVHVTRMAIVPVWLIAFALLALVWSPLSVTMGGLLLVVAVAAPAAMLFWHGR